MFSYTKRGSLSTAIKIGQFVSNNIQWTDNSGHLLSYEEINEWDRYELANRCLNEIFYFDNDQDPYNLIGGSEYIEIFLKECAIKIDELIPKRYFVKHSSYYNTYNTTDGTILIKKFISKDDHESTKRLIYKIKKG